MRQAFLARYEVHRVGGRVHDEYWIPAEDLEVFNRNIVGLIEVIAEYAGGPDHQPVRVRWGPNDNSEFLNALWEALLEHRLAQEDVGRD